MSYKSSPETQAQYDGFVAMLNKWIPAGEADDAIGWLDALMAYNHDDAMSHAAGLLIHKRQYLNDVTDPAEQASAILLAARGIPED